MSPSPKLMAMVEATVGGRSAAAPTIWTNTLRGPPRFAAESGKT